ncbi:hypothetical protein CONLIGDRAFT_650389 [Coniochaeta ligniaria NRRL 30616]|uniref:Zn(2)-C6 fungal-type domain-containing protein n=1 Tax=Coniochaeta ligniaria NRRL 30616 TaxID=1408157 RepID=A0A1J7J0N9_9PEZI|nr:hypothetical protein CONLIGDRAFT_650389 [Coniochaeta ligniaria NRRL 30616]
MSRISGIESSLPPSSPFLLPQQGAVIRPPLQTPVIKPLTASGLDYAEVDPSYPLLNASQSPAIIPDRVSGQDITGAPPGKGTDVEHGMTNSDGGLAPAPENSSTQIQQPLSEEQPTVCGPKLTRGIPVEPARPIIQCTNTFIPSNEPPSKKRKLDAEQEIVYAPSIPYPDPWRTNTMQGIADLAHVSSAKGDPSTMSHHVDSLETPSQATELDLHTGSTLVYATETPIIPYSPDFNHSNHLKAGSTISQQPSIVLQLPLPDIRFGTSVSGPPGLRRPDLDAPFLCTGEQVSECVDYVGSVPNIQERSTISDSGYLLMTVVEEQPKKMTTSAGVITSTRAMAERGVNSLSSPDGIKNVQTTLERPESGTATTGLSRHRWPFFSGSRRQSCDFCHQHKLMCNATVCSWKLREEAKNQRRNRTRCDNCRRSKFKCDVTEMTGCTHCTIRSLTCISTKDEKPIRFTHVVQVDGKEESLGALKSPADHHSLGPNSNAPSWVFPGVAVGIPPVPILPPSPASLYSQSPLEAQPRAFTASESPVYSRTRALPSEAGTGTSLVPAATQVTDRKLIISQWPRTVHYESCPNQQGDAPPRYTEYKVRDILDYMRLYSGHVNLYPSGEKQHRRQYKSRSILGVEITLLLDQCGCREGCLGTCGVLHATDACIPLNAFEGIAERKVVTEFRRILCSQVTSRVYDLGCLEVQFLCTKALFMFMGANRSRGTEGVSAKDANSGILEGGLVSA